MPSTEKREQIVQQIDAWVKETVAQGGGDKELLESIADYMIPFKEVMKTSSKSELNAFTQQYDGFERFARLLEQLAAGIADGSISVPGSNTKKQKPKGNGFG